jgi:hypothetical protein
VVGYRFGAGADIGEYSARLSIVSFPLSPSPPFPCPSLALLLPTMLLVGTPSPPLTTPKVTPARGVGNGAEGLSENMDAYTSRVLAPLDFGVPDLYFFFFFIQPYVHARNTVSGSCRCVSNVIILFKPPFFFFFFFVQLR